MLADGRYAIAAAILCGAVLFTCIETSAQSLPKEIASRTEIYAIPSLTLSDQQFLTGDEKDAKPVTVAGEFRVAQGTGRLPVVVMMHGSGGVSPAAEAWVHTFNAMGVSTFVIDGFSGRGLTSTSTRTWTCAGMPRRARSAEIWPASASRMIWPHQRCPSVQGGVTQISWARDPERRQCRPAAGP